MKRLLTLALAVSILIPLTPLGTAHAQEQEEDQVARLMERMSSAAKVGQLFLVTFPGAEVTEDTVIAELIRDYHVGGVVLLPDNGNIVNEGDTPAQVATLVGQLQETAWEATQPVTETFDEEIPPGPFIPLFIAASHEGNGMPFTGIINGMTPLPSEMALGATWSPAYAEAVGQIVGQELHALGVNVLLGPSLDVLENQSPASTGDLGVRAFGGEPFWVGQMGQAYIRGVHTGTEGRMAVIAKHFPGLGASDRSLDEEVSTVQRTLEKLRQVDLAPFSAVAQAEDPLARPNGVMVSHIRFRGLEGGRFVTTRPVSVDSQVLQRLLGLPELVGWREQGGLTVSDELGVRALRRFYDPSEESFNSRRIAQDAFLAGNDILLLSQFALSDDWEDQLANVRSTVTFFQEKYDTDLSFQALVDAAVARILRLKLSLYDGTFELATTQPDAEMASEQVGLHQEPLSAIGRDAVTLLFPPSPDLFTATPTLEDNIVIFTDSREGRPCATCAPVTYIDPLALRDTIVRLYGPDATGQINPSLVTNFTFDQLEEALNVPPLPPTPTPAAGEVITPTSPPIEAALQNADWIIFAILNPTADLPQSGVVRRFLAERADALRDPYLVVLAYDAPYYLDTTEISKLSAYYVAYSRIEPFIEASVRALFSEFAPLGTPPISVTGINYDLLIQTLPDPEQAIVLHFDVIKSSGEGEPTPEPTMEGQPTSEPTVEGQPTLEPPQPEVGDELKLRTGVVMDHNGHPVPDGTPVQFFFNYPREGLEHSIVEVTHGGVAETTVPLNRTGQLDISVQADPVPRTTVLQITITEDEPITIWTPTPLPSPTPTPTPTPTPEPAPVVEDTPTPTPNPVEYEKEPPPAQEAGVLDLLLAMVGVLIAGGIGYYVVRLNHGSVSLALRLALWCAIGGLALYLAYLLRLPGVAWLRERGGVWIAGGAALLGGITPLGIMWIAGRRKRSSRQV
ncbi:MAG: glycoside hydrolase family 3 N-terminal domain-containing protein [Chloroflexota bacterium]|nr:glycoside hydrolase family 3 N-terminal domain-containing protein [Chloroflexota bacterium]